MNLLQFLFKKKKPLAPDYSFSPSSFELVGGPDDGAIAIQFASPDRIYMKSNTPGVYVIYEKISDTKYEFVGYGPAPWEEGNK